MTADDVRQHLQRIAIPSLAQSASRFFKTGPGQYGEGDVFIGIKVPTLRVLSRQYRELPLEELESLLSSPIHEERHLALMILVLQVAKCSQEDRRKAFEFYLDHTSCINNWDLVDCSAPHVVGGYLITRSRKPLMTLAKSKSLWERRIAIVATQHFIRQWDFVDTLKIAKMLLKDSEDLIHKATGWMLREVGDRKVAVLEEFLDQHATKMPRTMLRYAIEKLPPDQRQAYLKQK